MILTMRKSIFGF